MDLHHIIITDDTTDPMAGYLLRASVTEQGTDISICDGHPWAADHEEHEVMRMLNTREVLMLAQWMLRVSEAQMEEEARAVAARRAADA